MKLDTRIAINELVVIKEIVPAHLHEFVDHVTTVLCDLDAQINRKNEEILDLKSRLLSMITKTQN